jgi:hypothetical protein
MVGFYELATGLQAPILGILRAQQPIVSGGHLKNSRFLRDCGRRPGSICTAWPRLQSFLHRFRHQKGLILSGHGQ